MLSCFVKTIEEVKVWNDFPLEKKVFPVVVPENEINRIPVAVYARVSGLVLDTFRGGAVKPALRFDILHDEYEALDELMDACIRALDRKNNLFLIPEPQSDSYDETLHLYRQSIHVVLIR